MHQRPGNSRRASALLLLAALVATAIGSAAAFSFSRALHEVRQDIAEDASLYSQELHLNAPDYSAHSNQQKNLDKYVTIKTSPASGILNIPRGQRLELSCEVDGSPPPRIYWVMGDNPAREVKQLEHESVADVSYTAIAREVSKLVIDCVTPLDQGLIHCVGVAGDKIVISEPTVLNVIEGNKKNGTHECRGRAGKPVITRYRPIYFSEMGSTVVLPCEATGDPRPHVRWLDGDNNKLEDSRFAVQPNGNLVITNLRWNDMDGYKCTASSDLGDVEAVTFLYPAAKPTPGRKAIAL